MRCRARRSLAVKRLLISRGIRRVAAQATKRKRLNGQLCSRPAACSAACSAITEKAGKSRSVAHLYSCCLWRHCASGAETSCRTLFCGTVLEEAACEAPDYLGGLLLDTGELRT